MQHLGQQLLECYLAACKITALELHPNHPAEITQIAHVRHGCEIRQNDAMQRLCSSDAQKLFTHIRYAHAITGSSVHASLQG